MYGLEEIIEANEKAMAKVEEAAKETAKADPYEDVGFLKAALTSALMALRIIENGEDLSSAVVANAARLAIGLEGGSFTEEDVEREADKFDARFIGSNDNEKKLIVAA